MSGCQLVRRTASRHWYAYGKIGGGELVHTRSLASMEFIMSELVCWERVAAWPGAGNHAGSACSLHVDLSGGSSVRIEGNRR